MFLSAKKKNPCILSRHPLYSGWCFQPGLNPSFPSFSECCLLLLLQKQVSTSRDPKVSHKASGWYRISDPKAFLLQTQPSALPSKPRHRNDKKTRVVFRTQSAFSSRRRYNWHALCAHMTNPATPQHSAKPEQRGRLWFRTWMKPQRSTKTRLSISLSSININAGWKMRFALENKGNERAKPGLWPLIICTMNATSW